MLCGLLNPFLAIVGGLFLFEFSWLSLLMYVTVPCCLFPLVITLIIMILYFCCCCCCCWTYRTKTRSNSSQLTSLGKPVVGKPNTKDGIVRTCVHRSSDENSGSLGYIGDEILSLKQGL